MNSLLWVFSAVLALVFLITGYVKVFAYETAKKRWTWVSDFSRALVILIGLFEITAALALVLPGLLRLYTWLTPAAAIGLALLMLSASSFHSIRHERDDASTNFLLFLMTAFVAYGRLMLAPLS